MTSIWVGQRVRLRGIEPSDWEDFRRFDENSEDMQFADLVHPPRSAAGYRKWAEEQAIREPADGGFTLAIEAEGRLVGSIAAGMLSPRAGRFMYGISVGHEHKRRGYGTEAAILLLAYMFGERRFHKCEVTAYSVNAASLRLHESLGFVVEGRRRDHEFFAGRYQDQVLLGITADEFWARHGDRTPAAVTPR